MKEYRLTVNHHSQISSRTICRKKLSIFFDTIKNYIEKQIGAIQFHKIKVDLRDYYLSKQNWSDDRWLVCLASDWGSKRRYQYCIDYLGSIIYLRAFQGHSGNNLIDLALQENVLSGLGIFPYIYHVGCAFNLHSIIGNGLIPGGQNLGKKQSVFFLPVDPRNDDHKNPKNIDYSVPRHARYLQNTWKKHQDTIKGMYPAPHIHEHFTIHKWSRQTAYILTHNLNITCLSTLRTMA